MIIQMLTGNVFAAQRRVYTLVPFWVVASVDDKLFQSIQLVGIDGCISKKNVKNIDFSNRCLCL